MVWSIVFGIFAALGLAMFTIDCTKSNTENECSSKGINYFSGVFTVIMAVCTVCSMPSNTATALDVYRGNTELQMTYTVVNGDTVKCDSVVIFKNIVK